MSEYFCIYCFKAVPSSVEPGEFSCCGEVGRTMTSEEYERQYGAQTLGCESEGGCCD